MLFIILCIFITLAGCNKKNNNNSNDIPPETNQDQDNPTKEDEATIEVTPTPNEIDASDPFQLKDAPETYPFLTIKDGIKKYGYMKLNGDIMIDPVYDYASLYQEGFAVISSTVKNKQNNHMQPLYQVIDQKGKIIFENSYLVSNFQNGFAKFIDQESRLYHGYINTKGEVVIDANYLVAYNFDEHGETYALTSQEEYVKIDNTGKILESYIVNPNQASYTFEDGYLIYHKGNGNNQTTGVVHLDGTNILDPIYWDITYLGNDLFAVKEYKDELDLSLYSIEPSAIFDAKGEQVSDFIYYDISTFTNGYASATDNTHTYLIGLDGKKATNMPTLEGRGTMVVLGNLIQATIDNELLYLDIKGNILAQSNTPIQLDDNITIISKKYKTNKYILVYYPEVTGLSDATVEDSINQQLKTNFVDTRLTIDEELFLTVSDDFEVELIHNLLLVHRTGYDYPLGAAHGMPISTYYMIDIQTGAFYQLQDLFLKDSNYVDQLNEIVKKDLNEQNEKEGAILMNPDFETIRPNHTFYVTKDSLVIYFTPYEIAAYAAGFPQVVIPFADIKDIIDLNGSFWKALGPS